MWIALFVWIGIAERIIELMGSIAEAICCSSKKKKLDDDDAMVNAENDRAESNCYFKEIRIDVLDRLYGKYTSLLERIRNQDLLACMSSKAMYPEEIVID